MKKTCFILGVLALPFLAPAQLGVDSNKMKAFLFSRFIDGYVLMKKGDVEQAPMNYNTDDQNIYFIQNGQYMVLTNLESIDTMFIQNKKFIPFKNAVYEVITDPSTSGIVYITYTNKARPMLSTADHTGSSKQSSNQVSNTVTGTYVSGRLTDNKSVEIEKHFWFEKNNKLYKADNLKQVTKIFPEKAKNIEKFVQENNTSFIMDNDLMRLAAFCKQ